nr:AraC family transcriptional regulator [Marinobacterium ramblicola]
MFDTLKHSNAQLLNSTSLPSGMQLALWKNARDQITQAQASHHTLSLYVADGYESYRKTGSSWHNGGAPDRACLMPQQSANIWDIRGPLTFVHLYFDDAHLRRIAEQTWDKSPAQISLDEQIFIDDPRITAIYRQFLLQSNWADPGDQLQLSSATNLLLSHLLKTYTQVEWHEIQVRGGLAPVQRKRVVDYIEAHLDRAIQLADLAAVAGLSEYHFARMFRQSLGIPPHQYLTNRRIERAKQLLLTTSLPLTEIALRCGFNSSSHFSNRFRQQTGVAPSKIREV